MTDSRNVEATSAASRGVALAVPSRDDTKASPTVQLPALMAEVQTLRTDTECDVPRHGSNYS